MGKTNIDENLFEAERRVLQHAMTDITNADYGDNELLPRYQGLVADYQKLLRITKKIFRISDSQGQVLQRHQNELQNLLDNADQGFLTFGRDLKVNRQFSAECIRIFGRQIAGVPITELLGPGCGSSCESLPAILERILLCRKGFEQEALNQVPSIFSIGGKDIRVECKLISQTETDTAGNLVMMILTDITERLRTEEQIRFLSYHDNLTALYNRAHVETVLPQMEKPEALPVSMIMIDMNGLKLVNDVFGHQQGDLILVSMAKVLQQSCRPQDVISRWGGDEFLIILPQTNSYDCLQVCQQIQAACAAVVDCAIPLSAAIGMATKGSGVVRLAEMFTVAESRMYNDKMMKGREVRKSIIACLKETLRTCCFENEGHCERVKKVVSEFAVFLGFAPNAAELKPLPQLAALHDIGKVTIPREILGKEGPLTHSEWEIVKSHSDVGYRMAQSIGEPAVAEIILALHEHWDGNGYPYGLKGDQIPVLARIFSLADTYDVLTHDRPYKAAMSKRTALREIEAAIGTQFDPVLARQFIAYLDSR